MSVIPQTVEFVHKVTWTIKNFALRPKYEGRLSSPEFDIRCLNVATWSFNLYPNGSNRRNCMQFVVRLHYSGNRDVNELHITSVKYVFYIIDASGANCFQKESVFSPSFQEPNSSPTSFIPLERFVEEIYLRNGSLVLVCELTTKVNQVEFLSSVYEGEMIALSNTLGEMIDHPTHCDMIAYSKEKVQFDVHKCIMKARCPVLFGDPLDPVEYTESRPAWSSNISTPALKALISYIYGRTTIHIQDSLRSELMSVAIRYQLLDLERKLREYPIDLSIVSDIIVEDITFTYPLKDIGWKCDEDTRRLHFLPTRNLAVSDLVLSLELTKGPEQDYLKIGFQFSDYETREPILLKCTMCIMDDCENELDQQEHWHTFHTDEEWTPPPFLTKSSFDMHRPHTLRCNALLTENFLEGQVSNNVCKVELGRFVLFNNLLLIGDDLQKLYDNQVNCDLRIKVENREFLGHRGFLVKRSPTIKLKVDFAEKAMEEDTDMAVIRLEGITPTICQMVLLYMYSGRISINDAKTADTLWKVARYLQLPRLMEKASFFKSG